MDVKFFLSSSISSNVMVKIHRVTGLEPVNVLEQRASRYYSPSVCSEDYELFVEVCLFQNGMQLGLPVCCSYQLFPAGMACIWDEWLRLPVRYCDISRDAQLVLTVFAVSPQLSPYIGTANDSDRELSDYINTHADWIRLKARPIGGVTLPLFDGCKLRAGRHKLRLAEDTRGDGSMDSPTLFYKLKMRETVKDRLEATLTRKRTRQIPADPWLDAMTARRISKACGIPLGKLAAATVAAASAPPLVDDGLRGVYLTVDLLNFGNEVVFHQLAYEGYGGSSHRSQQKLTTGGEVPTVASATATTASAGGYRSEAGESLATGRALTALSLLQIHDPEMGLSNPVAEKDKRLLKYSTMADIKPDKKERERLDQIIKSPTRELRPEDTDMLWTFRNSVVGKPKALTKFLRGVSQRNEDDMAVAIELMDRWAPIDVADSLELLSGSFEHREIRRYAIGVLQKHASDEELEGFLLQLVQAVRFEPTHTADLPQFLLQRSLKSDDFRLLNSLFWSVKVQSESLDEELAQLYKNYLKVIEDQLKTKRPKFGECIERQKWLVNELLSLSEAVAAIKGKADAQKLKLRQLLNDDARFSQLKHFPFQVHLPVRPEVVVDGIIPEKCSVFKSAMCPFLLCFRRRKLPRARIESFLEGPRRTAMDVSLRNIESPRAFRHEHVSSAGTFVQRVSVATSIGSLQSEDLEDEEFDSDDEDDDDVVSALRRKKTEESPGFYRIIWKTGDDLRQDQLIIQMISLMDSMLRKLKLDLCLTPYAVLATGLEHGMIEFVEESHTLFDLLKETHSDLGQFLSENARGGKTSALQDVIDTFVKSSAGYAVITFLLGVGDRHLHNLLMTTSGRLFHIDFGFIYGDDPKPWPPPMKICKPMIDAMGGFESPQYKDFLNHMSTCYNLLRKNANLILNLLALMGSGDLQKIEKDLNYVYTKFRLDLSDQSAANYLSSLVQESVNALFVKFVDKIHDWATYWR